MKKILGAFVIIFSLYAIEASGANIIFVSNAPNDYWVCKATDFEQKTWTAGNQYQRRAVLDALDACKKQSRFPNTCEAANEDCDGIISGTINRPVWRCTALDTLAKHWHSNISANEIEAAFSARALCEKESSVPLTCYVNMLTCENLNEKFIGDD